jgi:hypothetical protein
VSALTSRGKAVAGLAFLLSAVLCTGAAVALVKVSDREDSEGRAAPRPQPTLVLGSSSPTPTPSPVAVASSSPTRSPAAAATASPSASPRASATASRSASPRPRTSSSPRTTAPDGLRTSASLDPASGAIYPTTAILLKAHSTDGQGDIRLRSLDWGDGTVVTGGTGSACTPPTPGGDCANFSFTHKYAAAGNYNILLQITSGGETSVIPFTITIKDCSGPCATPTPSPAP